MCEFIKIDREGGAEASGEPLKRGECLPAANFIYVDLCGDLIK